MPNAPRHNRIPMKALIHLLVMLGAMLCAAPRSAQAQAHEHGAARLDVAFDGRLLSLRLEAPLEALFGFERAPRNAAERQLVDAGIARLKAADRMFRPDAAAACSLRRIELESAALKLGAQAGTAQPQLRAQDASAEHADLEATIEFDCKDSAKLAAIELGLFDAFARLQRIDVQIVTAKAQSKRMLKRPASRVSLPR
jgi:Protein of unknown function (DUF2796)